jgi:thiamine biosynthesis lipoprotein ApbE
MRSILLICAASIAMPMGSCHAPARSRPSAPALERHESTRVLMGVPARIVVYALDPASAERAFEAAFARIAQLDEVCSNYRGDSELARLGTHADGKPQPVSTTLASILAIAESVHAASAGAFDPTLGASTHLWREARASGTFPSPSHWKSVHARGGWSKLHFDRARSTVAPPAGLELDLGGIAKGAAAQAALEVLHAHGLEHALVALDGDIACGAAPPRKRGWNIEIDLGLPGIATRRVELVRASISTSGDSEQALVVDGVRHSHLIDARSGRPLTRRTAASVVLPLAPGSGALADALASAASLVGCEESAALFAPFPEATGWVAELRGDAIVERELPLTSARWIDLSTDARTERVLVDRDPGRYLGHVSTVLLADGRTLLAVYPQGHGKGAIVLKRSRDGGRTWSGRLPVPASFATSLECPSLHRVTDASGRERLVLFSGLHPCRASWSEDAGEHWTELAALGNWGGIVCMGSVEPLRAPRAQGTHAAWFHDDGRFFGANGRAEGVFTLYQTLSTDGGRTWEAPRALLSRSDVHLCEPGAVRSPDGRELTLLLRENRRVRSSHRMRSRDEGATWSEPIELPQSLCGDRHVARYAADGRLVIVFRDMASASPWKGDWVAWVGRYEDLETGRDGEFRLRLGDNKNAWDSTYAGLELLPDGTLVSTTYGHWDEGQMPYILCVRFRLPVS